MEESNIDQIKKIVHQVLDEAAKVGTFTDRKITDTPTDALATVNRKYVTLNGTTRPTSSVVGQFFLDTSLAAGVGKPIWWNGTGWIDATGSYV